MKKLIFLFAVLSLVLTIKTAKAGDQKPVDPFHSIIVSSDIKAELILSDNEAVQADFTGASEEDMIVEVVDSVLKIRMKTGFYKDSELKVKVFYTRDFRMMESNGRAQIWSEEDLYFDKNLTVKLFNGGEMRFNLVCDALNATVTQGAVIYLKGSTRALNVKVNTGGTFSGYEFKSQIADVEASGGGKAKISVSGSLKANASAKGFIGYVGEPAAVEKKTSLKGEILQTTLQ